MTALASNQTLLLSINQRLDALIPDDGSLLHQAARYSLLLPGKRLRPLFLLSLLKHFGKPIEPGLDCACAIEMIHAYSLIHDDLPCMDDDDLRRGKPTLHKVYGEGYAVLAGDFLLTQAFQTLAEANLQSKIILTIAQAAGGDGMIGGQVLDLQSEGKLIDWEILEKMYLRKTAALFSAALECAALLAEKDPTPYKEAGLLFGIAYQMLDDILDVTSTEEALGKPIGSDIANQKSTCVTLFGLEKAKARATFFAKKALKLLPKEGPWKNVMDQKDSPIHHTSSSKINDP